jgi:hypothetical protein
MALTPRRPAEGVIFHSDRGCQYTSKDYATLARANGMVLSVSRKRGMLRQRRRRELLRHHQARTNQRPPHRRPTGGMINSRKLSAKADQAHSHTTSPSCSALRLIRADQLLAAAVAPVCALLGGPTVVRVASAGDFRMKVEPLVEHRGRIWAEDPRRGGLCAAPGGARAGKRCYAGAGDCH